VCSSDLATLTTLERDGAGRRADECPFTSQRSTSSR
jgi:hypothetical protein